MVSNTKAEHLDEKGLLQGVHVAVGWKCVLGVLVAVEPSSRFYSMGVGWSCGVAVPLYEGNQ